MKIIRIFALAGFLALPGGTASAGIYDDILHASEQGDTERVVDLLRRGMDVNTTDPQGSSLLLIAARTGNAKLAKFLIDNRANPERRNRYGDTPLMIASMLGHTDIVRLLLDRKAETNHTGWNPLHYAAFENRAEIITLLVSAGADINLKAPNTHTALMLAAKRGHMESVRVLIGLGADASISDKDEGTAVAMARTAGHTDLAKFLERSGAR